MSQTLENLTRRSATVTSIRGIVHTMKTLSVINALPYERAASAIEAYHQTVLDGFATFLHRTGKFDLSPDRVAAQVLVSFGSDQGLCGNYNEALAAEIVRDGRELGGRAPVSQVLCVGARMSDALAAHGIDADAVLLPPASTEGIGRLASEVVARLDETRRRCGSADIAVLLAFTTRVGHGQQQPNVRELLPLSGAFLRGLSSGAWASRTLPDFAMAPSDLLASLIRSHIFASVFRASAEALVTENAARLARMHQAEQSIDDRLEALRNETRSVRQADITAELLDVITGFEALSAVQGGSLLHRGSAHKDAGTPASGRGRGGAPWEISTEAESEREPR